MHRKDSSVHKKDGSVHRSYEGSVHSTRDKDPIILEMLESLVQPDGDEEDPYEPREQGTFVGTHGFVHNPLAIELAEAHKVPPPSILNSLPNNKSLSLEYEATYASSLDMSHGPQCSHSTWCSQKSEFADWCTTEED